MRIDPMLWLALAFPITACLGFAAGAIVVYLLMRPGRSDVDEPNSTDDVRESV